MTEPCIETLEVDGDRFLELCADPQWRIVDVKAKPGGYLIRAERVTPEAEPGPRLPYRDD